MKALWITKENAHKVELTTIEQSQLPEHDVLVQIEYSTLNYKDALAITGKSPVVRSFPMIPGIDLAGTVLESADPDFAPGDKVLLNGYGVGEKHWGGLAQQARLKGKWLIKQPAGLSSHDTMAIGTAGYTAMLCIMALEDLGVTPDRGEVLVTGAAGGVGSVAVALLAGLGYQITASTGRKEREGSYLKSLGATTLIERSELSEKDWPLQKERWAGAIDVVGSHTLANVCSSMKYDGVVTACGLAQGMDLPLTVMPFILRGITLQGIDSVFVSRERRLEAWSRLAHDLDMSKLQTMISEISLDKAITMANDLLEGKVRGRIVVNVQA